jgi:hypothetical protein
VVVISLRGLSGRLGFDLCSISLVSACHVGRPNAVQCFAVALRRPTNALNENKTLVENSNNGKRECLFKK